MKLLKLFFLLVVIAIGVAPKPVRAGCTYQTSYGCYGSGPGCYQVYDNMACVNYSGPVSPALCGGSCPAGTTCRASQTWTGDFSGCCPCNFAPPSPTPGPSPSPGGGGGGGGVCNNACVPQQANCGVYGFLPGSGGGCGPGEMCCYAAPQASGSECGFGISPNPIMVNVGQSIGVGYSWHVEQGIVNRVTHTGSGGYFTPYESLIDCGNEGCSPPDVWGIGVTFTGTTPGIYANGAHWHHDVLNVGWCDGYATIIVRQPPAWWQVEGSGNVYSGDDLESDIPATCTGSCTRRLIKTQAGQDPGIAYYGDRLDTGAGTVSNTNWAAQSRYDARWYNYRHYFNQLGFSVISSEPDIPAALLINLDKPTTPPQRKAYYYDDDTWIWNQWNVNADEQIVILIDGDLNINNKIHVAQGGFLAFFVSGDINIGTNVNSEDGQPALEGMFVADNNISTGLTNTKLILEGTYVAWNNVYLQRDFNSARNSTEPAETFRYRPDFLSSAPRFLVRPHTFWEEVAP